MNILIKNCLIIDTNSNHNNKQKDILIINGRFEKISSKSNRYIHKSFNIALEIMNKKISDKMINGPVSKKFFLKKKYLGITEYLAHRTNTKNFAMLIYNKDLSVCPLTTHLPIKLVSKKINKNMIKKKVKLINNFFKKYLKQKPNIAL